jgi:hypothetical protein
MKGGRSVRVKKRSIKKRSMYWELQIKNGNKKIENR